MSVKTHYTSAATWTPASWVTKYRAVVAGGVGGQGNAPYAAGRGAVIADVVAVTGPVSVAPGAIAGGASGGSGAGKGGAGSRAGSLIAGGGSGCGVAYQGGVWIAYEGGYDGGAPGADAPPVSADATRPRTPTGGRSGGGGGAAGAVSAVTGDGGRIAAGAGVASTSGGAGGPGGYYIPNGHAFQLAGGGGGGGFGGGGGGGCDDFGGSSFPAPGAGGSSSGGALIGYNDGAPYVDVVVAGAPKAATLLGPTGNAWADRTKPIVLSFQHNPDTAGDSLDVQTDAQVQYRKVGDATWTTVTALGTATATPIAANTLTVGQYEWQARTKADGAAGNDATGVWGPWSTAEYFQADTPPAAPTVSSPASGATIAVATVSPVWSAPGQVEWEARLVGDSGGVANPNVLYDSKSAADAATTITLAAATNHVTAHVQVRIRTTVGGLWSDWADVPVTIEWAGPPKPRVTLATDWRIFVTVTNPPPVGVEPVADRIEVYVHENGIRERRAILTPGAGWIYETPPSGVEIGIEAVAIYTPTNVQTSSGVIY